MIFLSVLSEIKSNFHPGRDSSYMLKIFGKIMVLCSCTYIIVSKPIICKKKAAHMFVSVKAKKLGQVHPFGTCGALCII